MQKTVKIAVAVVAVAFAAALFAYPLAVSAAPSSPGSRPAFQSPGSQYATPSFMGHGFQGAPSVASRGGPVQYFGNQARNQVGLTVGQTISVTSSHGAFRVVGTQHANGTASGALTFTVTGKLSRGYTLAIAGSITVNGTTYTISSGSAEMGPAAAVLSGQGATSPTGQFLIHGMSRGSFVGSTAVLSLDFSNGVTEYLVVLTGPS